MGGGHRFGVGAAHADPCPQTCSTGVLNKCPTQRSSLPPILPPLWGRGTHEVGGGQPASEGQGESALRNDCTMAQRPASLLGVLP